MNWIFLLQAKTAIQADIDAIAESIDFLKFNHHYANVSNIISVMSYFFLQITVKAV